MKCQKEDIRSPTVPFVERYNGVFLPQAFWSIMQSVQGTRLLTDPNGRIRLPRVAPGTYELCRTEVTPRDALCT